MIQICVRVPEDMAKEVRRMAVELGVRESEIWRRLLHRGMDAEDKVIKSRQVETLCLARRIAAHLDMDVIYKAKADARHLLREMGVIE